MSGNVRVSGDVPPHDLIAEAAVLSAVLLDSSVLAEVEAVLEPEHFYADSNRRIFEAAAQLRAAGRDVDIVSVAGHLNDTNRLEQVGGTPYLAQLSDATPAVAHVGEHAARVRAKSYERESRDIGKALAAGAITREAAQERLAALSNPRAQRSRAVGASDVLAEWEARGPLTHEPTGIRQLDELTGGGPAYGTRWYVTGAPDAAKTALLLQLAHVYAQRGIAVGMLAVDEEASDLVTRLAQRVGYERFHCETGDPATLERIRAELGQLPLRIYSGDWSVEAAAADVAAYARSRGSRAILCIDSLQTVRCDVENARDMAEVAAVGARVAAIRSVATRYQLIALVTSEMGRGSYRSGDPEQQTATLAAAKWSGAVEYSARVLIGLRSVAGESDMVDLELAKNKHGPRDRHVYLRIDRARQVLWEVGYEPAPSDTASRDSVAKDRVVADAAIAAKVLLAQPGITARAFRAAVRASSGMGVERVDAALALLGDSVVREDGPRNSVQLSLCVDRVPDRVRHALEASND